MAKFFQSNNPNRQKLVRPLTPAAERSEASQAVSFAVPGPRAVAVTPRSVTDCIQTRRQLQEALVNAFKLELSTIPPYMCGLYSIRDGTNVECAKLIRGVLVEEMLHMVLVANLLNAISEPGEVGKLLKTKEVMAAYPTALPGNIVPAQPKDFKIHLLPFSERAIDEFLAIECPADPHVEQSVPGVFESIGQFYLAIRWGFQHLSEAGGLFIGDPKWQITEEHYYGSGGKIVAVECLKTAELAIGEIVGQGEGIDGTIQDPDSTLFGEEIEVAHYFKFQEIRCQRFYRANDTNQQAPTKSVPTGAAFEVSYSSALAMKPNPKVADYAHELALKHMAIRFNELYTRLIAGIIRSANGEPAEISRAIPLMHELRERAKALMNVQLPDGSFAGPTFEYTT